MTATHFNGPVYSDNGFINAPVSVTDAATYTVLAANTGKTHIVPNLTADCTITLPSPVAGLEYEFVHGGVAADAQDWIISTGSNTNYFIGGILHMDSDAGAAADELVPVAPDGNSNSKLTINVPDVATRVRVLCDGTLWLVQGMAVAVTAPAFADQ